MNKSLTADYEAQLVNAWESSYKQGLLTLWIFLALHDGPKSLADIRAYLLSASDNTIVADDKSLYRSLRRYYATDMVDFASQPSEHGGPPTKVYSLSVTGQRVLHQFPTRNISVLLHNQQIKELLAP